MQTDQETDHGYEKTYKEGGRLVHEQWDSNTKYGEYGIVLGDRFAVKVSGNADSIDQLKAAVGGINLAGTRGAEGCRRQEGLTERQRHVRPSGASVHRRGLDGYFCGGLEPRRSALASTASAAMWIFTSSAAIGRYVVIPKSERFSVAVASKPAAAALRSGC